MFGEQYIALRKKEQRLYSDEEVRQLPAISPMHPHYKEWVARERSCNRLLKHLEKIRTPLRILEIGCGNGWLAHKLSAIEGAEVTGYDINQVELYQAIKVFAGKSNLHFTIKDPFATDGMFDIIIFAASIQYFPSLKEIIFKAMAKLLPGGSIHIIDSHFYAPAEVPAAQKRSEDYFSAIGFEGMSENYFHHSLEELDRFNHELVYDPNSLLNKLIQRKAPFHWIRIPKQ